MVGHRRDLSWHPFNNLLTFDGVVPLKARARFQESGFPLPSAKANCRHGPAKLLPRMTDELCNVAVAVPLRTAFTYKIPARLAGEIQPGSRVLVPFRRKSAVGVVTEFVTSAPPGAKLREVQKSLDLVPALTAKLLELGQWIAS